MKVLNKKAVISMLGVQDNCTVEIEGDAFITKDAREYLDTNGIHIIREGKIDTPNATTDTKRKKLEHMTYRDAKEYVVKNHPRIVFRGKLDTFQAKILELQVLAESSGNQRLLGKLDELLEYSRNLLLAEVTDKSIEGITLFGLDEGELRYLSQHPKENFGVDHIAPAYKMGGECILLNSLRALSREVEIAGINAFYKNGSIEREDIIKALNRLSSGIYILYCEMLSQRKDT